MPLDLTALAGAPVPGKDFDQGDAQTTAEEIVKRYASNLKGKSVLVTGVSPGGIGAAACLALATGEPKLLILAGRNMEKVIQTAKDVKAINPDIPVRTLELDLCNLKQVTAAAKSLSDFPSIDIIINNAGIMGHHFSLTPDGVESQFSANYLGHFQLIRILLPQLQASAGGGTVVNVTSVGHWHSGVDFSDPTFSYHNGEKYDRWSAYGQAKSANILHALHLSYTIKRAAAVHPGGVNTHLMEEPSGDVLRDVEAAMGSVNRKFPKSPSVGASTVLWAVLDEGLEKFVYGEDCRVTRAAPHAVDEKVAERLAKASAELVDGKLGV